jgi:cellulose biosynthesis protein BcsQ
VTKYIAASNRRGGVGKTTTTMMLAYGLAVTGRQRVLLIDLAAQASTSMVMMGHKRWREAREANRTNAGLLTQLVGDDNGVHRQRHRRRDAARRWRADARHHAKLPRSRRSRGAADDRPSGALP